MASLSLKGAFSLASARSSVRIPGSSKPKHYVAISRIRMPSRAPQVEALPPRGQGFESLRGVRLPRGHGFKSLRVTPPSEGANSQLEEADVITAVPTVMAFYQGLNRRDVKSVTQLLADNCVFNDSQFPGTFEGKKMVLKFVNDLVRAMEKDIIFVIEEVSEGDDLNVVVLWHLECEGKVMPLTKGCSFHHCEKQGERIVIRFVQDFMEQPLKPGQLILQLLKMISSLFKASPYIAQKLLTNPYYAFGGVIAIYRNYLHPIIWPFVNPFIIYYRMVIKIFVNWITFFVNIVLKIMKYFNK